MASRKNATAVYRSGPGLPHTLALRMIPAKMFSQFSVPPRSPPPYGSGVQSPNYMERERALQVSSIVLNAQFI